MIKKIICVSIYTLDEYGFSKEQKLLRTDLFDNDELDELWNEYEIDPSEIEEITLSELEELLF